MIFEKLLVMDRCIRGSRLLTPTLKRNPTEESGKRDAPANRYLGTSRHASFNQLTLEHPP